jgi:hypothetical protein
MDGIVTIRKMLARYGIALDDELGLLFHGAIGGCA